MKQSYYYAQIMHAVDNGNFKEVKALFENRKNNLLGDTIPMWYAFRGAAIKGNIPTLEYLINHKMDVNYYPGYSGETALYWAVNKGHLDVVKFLHGKGADMYLKHRDIVGYDKDGNCIFSYENPLVMAKRLGRQEIFAFLDSHKDVSSADRQYHHQIESIVNELIVDSNSDKNELLANDLCDIINTFEYRQSVRIYKRIAPSVNKNVRQKLETIIREQRERS